MADDPTPVETGRKEPDSAGTPDETGANQAPAARIGRRLPWIQLLIGTLCALLLLVELAGLLLRDPLESRLPRLAEAPATIGEAEPTATAVGTEGARFGPEIREVQIGGLPPVNMPVNTPAEPMQTDRPSQRSSAAERHPAVEPATPTPAALPVASPEPISEPTPEPVTVPRLTTEPLAPTPAATQALQVGIFRSQRYRHEMEQRLAAAGLPYFLQEQERSGVGYRFFIAPGNLGALQNAKNILQQAGYLFREDNGALTCVFHFEEEAQRALAQLAAKGYKGSYTKVEGSLPAWTVLVGPFDADTAKKTRQQLAILGLPSYLRTLP